MNITKFVHSCLLIEDQGKTFLFDPGNYTFDEKALNLESLENLDYLLITHEHPDHLYVPLIKEIKEKFPEVKILTNESAKKILAQENLEATTELPDFVTTQLVPHEKMFGGKPPLNNLFVINDTFSHPGDSHHFSTNSKVLALPVQAPWGSTSDAVFLAENLKPEVIVPIHDWHWNEKARENMYKRLEDYFGKLGIKFIGLQTGVKVTV